MDVLGPKCNGRSSTLTPSEACLPYLCASAHRLFRVALRQEQAAEVGAENALRLERGRKPPPQEVQEILSSVSLNRSDWARFFPG